MYIGAIDIETMCPTKSPPEIEMDDSQYFIPTAIGVGRMDTETGTVVSDVLFRDGGTDDKWTADLLQKTVSWFDERPVDALLTYNGTGFDEPHLLYWANEHGCEDEFERLFETHVDLYMVIGSRSTGFEDACVLNGITPQSTKYKDYDIPTSFSSGTSSPAVSNKHIGTFLGEQLIELLETEWHSEYELFQLQSLFYDYTIADIDPLFKLYEKTPESHVH